MEANEDIYSDLSPSKGVISKENIASSDYTSVKRKLCDDEHIPEVGKKFCPASGAGDSYLNDIAILDTKLELSNKLHEETLESLRHAHKTIEKLERDNIILKKNISSLYKTAKAELDRKTSALAELQKKIDRLILNCKTSTHDKEQEKQYRSLNDKSHERPGNRSAETECAKKIDETHSNREERWVSKEHDRVDRYGRPYRSSSSRRNVEANSNSRRLRDERSGYHSNRLR